MGRVYCYVKLPNGNIRWFYMTFIASVFSWWRLITDVSSTRGIGPELILLIMSPASELHQCGAVVWMAHGTGVSRIDQLLNMDKPMINRYTIHFPMFHQKWEGWEGWEGGVLKAALASLASLPHAWQMAGQRKGLPWRSHPLDWTSCNRHCHWCLHSSIEIDSIV